MDATGLDVLLDNLENIEGTATEGVLYMTQADYDAFNAAGVGLLATWDARGGSPCCIRHPRTGERPPVAAGDGGHALPAEPRLPCIVPSMSRQ
jgi:hypothetical protein